MLTVCAPVRVDIGGGVTDYPVIRDRATCFSP